MLGGFSCFVGMLDVLSVPFPTINTILTGVQTVKNIIIPAYR